MPTVDELLASLADAARANQKAEFDRLERELLALYDGAFEHMPKEIYQRYLDVDRHWPVAVDGAPRLGRTLEIRLPADAQSWLEELTTSADRSLSAVVASCLEAVREDAALEARVRETLERGRQRDD
jgi:hypothetical protein